MKKAVVLLSGGLDSATCLAIAKSEGYGCYTLSFDYGQKHRSELQAATAISQQIGAIEHRIFHLPISELGGSALTDEAIAIPDYSDSTEIPVTYVPARNTIFLAIALGWAEIIKAHDIFIGVSSIDYSHYPDCRPEFVEQFQYIANLATREGDQGARFTIHAPLIYLSKAETISRGIELGVDYGKTTSCYRANQQGEACGTCSSCTLRKKGFTDLGKEDPTRYF